MQYLLHKFDESIDVSDMSQLMVDPRFCVSMEYGKNYIFMWTTKEKIYKYFQL